MRNPGLATSATVLLLLQACGGGGGGRDTEVISEVLIRDDRSSCSIEAQVYSGPDVARDREGICIVVVSFALFDSSGNELSVNQPLFMLLPEQTFTFHLHICSGQIGIPGTGLPLGPTTLFLIEDVDQCPSGTSM